MEEEEEEERENVFPGAVDPGRQTVQIRCYVDSVGGFGDERRQHENLMT